jgi:Spy/CpxP family protein refolding chaperone
MLTARKLIPATCIAVALAGAAVYTAGAAATAPAATAPAGGHHWHHHRHGFMMGFVMHKLNLSDSQKTQVKGVFASEKSQFEALHASVKANREALETTAPSSPDYPALVQQAQTNAAQRVKLESETWSAIYTSVLDKPQRDAIPGIVAAARAERAARMAAWQAAHPQAAAPANSD